MRFSLNIEYKNTRRCSAFVVLLNNKVHGQKSTLTFLYSILHKKRETKSCLSIERWMLTFDSQRSGIARSVTFCLFLAAWRCFRVHFVSFFYEVVFFTFLTPLTNDPFIRKSFRIIVHSGFILAVTKLSRYFASKIFLITTKRGLASRREILERQASVRESFIVSSWRIALRTLHFL